MMPPVAMDTDGHGPIQWAADADDDGKDDMASARGFRPVPADFPVVWDREVACAGVNCDFLVNPDPSYGGFCCCRCMVTSVYNGGVRKGKHHGEACCGIPRDPQNKLHRRILHWEAYRAMEDPHTLGNDLVQQRGENPHPLLRLRVRQYRAKLEKNPQPGVDPERGRNALSFNVDEPFDMGAARSAEWRNWNKK